MESLRAAEGGEGASLVVVVVVVVMMVVDQVEKVVVYEIGNNQIENMLQKDRWWGRNLDSNHLA